MAASLRKRQSLTEAVELETFKDSVISSPTLFHRPRANIEGVNLQDAHIVRNHYLHHGGSVRTDFTTETSTRVSQRIWKKINNMGGKRKGYSLFLFSKKNRFRRNVKRIAKSKVFKFVMGLIVLLHSITLALYQPSVDGDVHCYNKIIYYVTIVVVVLYILEAGLNIIAYGLIQSKKAYLRKSYAAHILDILVILLGILYIALTPHNILLGEVFASLMAFKLIKLIILSESVRFILNALAKSFAPLFYLFILTFLVITFLALIGIQLFKGTLHGGCFSEFSTPAGLNKSILISDFPCSRNLNTTPGSHTCPHGSTCSDWEEGPHRGIISFDNMGVAYLTVFQVISLEGWVGILYLYEAALGYAWVWVYFIAVMFFGSIFILNLWTGVLTSVFLGVSDREEEYGKSRKLKEKQRINEDLQNYNDWLKIAAEMDAPSDTGSIIDRRHSFFMWSDPMDEDSDEGTDSEEESPGAETAGTLGSRKRARALWHKLRKAVRKVVKNKFFLWFVLTLRAINLILLMSLHFPSDLVFDTVIYALNYMFSVLYLSEFLLRVFSLSKRKYLYYWKNSLHLFEILLSVLTVLDLVVFSGIQVVRDMHFGIFINAVWCLKLIMLFKHTRVWGGMKEILATVFQLLPSVLSLIALVTISLFVYTILGIRLFGGRLSNTGIVEPNFDNIFKSFLLVFQLMTSEDWNSLLFSSLDHWISALGTTLGGLFALYFVVGIVFGTFILLSVFLAMSVDKLSEVRSLRLDSAEQQEKTEKQRKEKKQHLSELKKDEEEPIVRRRTVRRAMRYISVTGSEPHSVKQQKKRKVFSLRLKGGGEDTRNLRSSSTPHSDSISSPAEGSEMSSSSQSESPDKRKVKLRNPLRLMTRQKSEFFEQQRRRVGAIDSHAGAGKLERQHKRVATNLSLDSSRKVSETDYPQSPTSYERSQSSPADTPFATDTTAFSELPKLDPIEEVHTLTDNEDPIQEEGSNRRHLKRQDSMVTSPESSRYPPSQSAPDDQLLTAMYRGHSLTDFTPISENLRDTSSRKKTALKFKDKVWRVFKWVKDYVGTIQLNPEKELAEIPNHSSFFILSPDNRFRELCFRVVSSRAFSIITYVAVFISSLVLTIEVPVGVDRMETVLCSLQTVVLFLDCFFMAYFFLEMALKMIALGVVFHRGSYLRGLFNILDFFILIVNVVPIIVYFAGDGIGTEGQECTAYSYHDHLSNAIGVLRVFRVLRPIRAIRIGGLYLVVTGLLSSVKSMGSILFLTFLVLLVFSVSGVQIFRGQFWFCTDPGKSLEQDCRGQHYVYDYTLTEASQFPGLPCPRVEERMWDRRGLNFDHVGFALLTLFSMLTIEGWQNSMYAGLNSFSPVDSRTPIGLVPGSTESPFSVVYFLLYMIVMAFILVQLFTGFVIVTFQEVGVKSFRQAKLDRNQRNCLYFALTAKPLRQYNPRFKWHKKFRKTMLPIVNHFITKCIIAAALIINCILLACVTYPNEAQNKIIYYINIFFTVFFAVEAIVKIVVLTPPAYFRSLENVFDFAIVIASIVELIVQLSLASTSTPPLLQRYENSHIASSFRVLRLINFIPHIRLILWTVVKSLEIFPWVGFLLMIIFFMYTVIGMQVFGNIRRAPIDELTPTREITEYNNFANFPQALLVMIRVATGENWQDIMVSCLPGQLCERQPDLKECGDNFAYFFFPTFYFISSIIVLNLLVAIVIDNFDYILRDKSILGAHQLDIFVRLWSIYDPDAKGVLPSKTVVDLMRQCNPPVGWGQLCPTQQAYRKMVQMNMPTVGEEGSNVTFNATLFALVRTSLKIQCEGCPECARKCNVDLRNKLRILFPTMPASKIDNVLPTENDNTVGEEYAALLVQRIWRAYIMRRRKVLELFHENKRVLKAGLRTVPDVGPDLLQRNSSDFEFQLPPVPSRKVSQVTNTSIDRSPSVFSSHFLTVDIEPSSPDRLYSPPSVSPTFNTEPATHTPSPWDDTREPFAPVLSRGHLSQASPEPNSSATPMREARDAPRTDSTADNVSELSFTSAYSNPVGDYHGDSGGMETTV